MDAGDRRLHRFVGIDAEQPGQYPRPQGEHAEHRDQQPGQDRGAVSKGSPKVWCSGAQEQPQRHQPHPVHPPHRTFRAAQHTHDLPPVGVAGVKWGQQEGEEQIQPGRRQQEIPAHAHPTPSVRKFAMACRLQSFRLL